MAENIKIQLDDIYRPITQDDVKAAKNFVLRREAAARALVSATDGMLQDAAEKIARISYIYGIEPRTFQISARYNPDMFIEVAAVLDELEDGILDELNDYATRCTKDKDKKQALFIWMMTLGKGNKAFKSTMEDRIRMFVRDLEAMLVAAKTARLDIAQAVNTIKNNLHTAYQMPGMKAAFKNASLYRAEFIRSRGVKHGYRGGSNSEANNIDRMVRTTLQMAWMHYHRELAEERGATGYYVLRGSLYPCELCNSKVGVHQIDDKEGYPPFHANCVCYAVPVYGKDIVELTL